MDRSLRREARVVLAEEVSAALDGSSTMVLISDCRVMSAETKLKKAFNFSRLTTCLLANNQRFHAVISMLCFSKLASNPNWFPVEGWRWGSSLS